MVDKLNPITIKPQNQLPEIFSPKKRTDLEKQPKSEVGMHLNIKFPMDK